MKTVFVIMKDEYVVADYTVFEDINEAERVRQAEYGHLDSFIVHFHYKGKENKLNLVDESTDGVKRKAHKDFWKFAIDMGNCVLKYKFKTIDELTDEAKRKAHKDFVKFAKAMGHDHSHTLDEFIETSNINGWLYTEEGVFME